jgi:hypothetical protein
VRWENVSASDAVLKMLQLEKGRKQRRQWEKMERRGHPFEIALNALIFAASYGFVRLVHVLGFKLGWIHSPGTTHWEEFFVWAAVGIVIGERYWWNMKRGFTKLPPEEDGTTKQDRNA